MRIQLHTRMPGDMEVGNGRVAEFHMGILLAKL